MVFCKLRPATPEVHLAISIVLDLHFIGSSSSRVFMKNCFPQLPPIHELSKLQRHPLNLAALSAGDTEEGINFRWRRRRSSTLGATTETLGLFLLPTGRPGRRFTGMDDEATATGSLDLFLLPRGRPQPRFSTCAPMFMCEPPALAMGGKYSERKP
jgi:hypothetical protein